MPPRGRKRKSTESVASDFVDAPSTITATMTTTTSTTAMGQKVPTKTEDSPSKRRKVGVTLAQKQALIDNLQLEGESFCVKRSHTRRDTMRYNTTRHDMTRVKEEGKVARKKKNS